MHKTPGSLFIFIILTFSIQCLWGQNTFRAVIKDQDTKENLAGARILIKSINKGGISDVDGYVRIDNIPDGKYVIEFRYIYYETKKDTFVFPLTVDVDFAIFLEPEPAETDEIVITSTRSTRSFQEIPTRIEFIAGEELDEKSNMKTGDIRMLLSESTGIQTQQTSATSANASIRIQGLDGRYTQILKDGFPLFAGAASGLGLLQTPPLDLKQVEILKGSASTLYGGGAIAGLVNLISKTPEEERDLRFHINGISGNGLDINGFFGQKFDKIGTTVFAAYNRHSAYDPAGIDLSAIPRFDRFVFNPKLFYYFNEKTKVNFGLNSAIENRLGGDIHYIQGKGDSLHSYFEENNTQRYSTQFSFDHKLNDNNILLIKNSYSYFNRKLSIPQYSFEGIQKATFTEISYINKNEKSEWIMGLNAWTDDFQEKSIDTFQLRNYNQITLGAFIQNTWNATKRLSIESGFRTDYVMNYGMVYLPRISILLKISEKLTSRMGAGFGYKTPNIFTEESERIQFRNVMPVDNKINKLEHSVGENIDFNYKTLIGNKISFSINQLFFNTWLNKPLLLEPTESGAYQFVNADGHIDTKGMETNIKTGYKDFKLFLGYTFTDTRLHQNGIITLNTLTPRHRINSVLMYEVDEKWKFGLEAYYFSTQILRDGATGKSYVICGFMIEKLWEKVSIYINFENFLDARQTRFDTVYTGTLTYPVFRDIYAPLDGFLMNGGIKIRL